MDKSDKLEKSGRISRRQFVGALGLAGTALLIGGGTNIAKAALPKKWEKQTDVIVMGLGATGAAAAIEAHDNGAKVIILEKMPMAGGSTALSGGIIYAANTSVQKSAGISDSVDGMYKFWMTYNNNLLNPEMVKTLCNESAEIIEWLKKLGVEFPPNLLYFSGVEEEYDSVTPAVKRGHCAKDRGRGLMSILMKAIGARKIEILYETAGERLIVDANGEVIGVQAKRKGKVVNVKATKGVVIASGGFTRNNEMVTSYFPLQRTAVPVTALGLTGDGILMAEKIGSPIVDTGTVELPPSLPALEITQGKKAIMFSSGYFLYKHPCIFVNEAGKRFCNETAYYQLVSPLLLRQKSAFIIFDDKTKKTVGAAMGYGFSEDLRSEIADGHLKQASTVGELARLLGIDATNLEKTVSDFNTNADSGKDPEFGRKKAMGAITTAPFYGGRLTVSVVESFGGLKINTKSQVLDAFNEPIPRLYAGGAVTACLRAYPASGAFLANCFVFGRIAGKNAAGEKQKEK